MFVYLQSQNRSYRSELPARRVGRSVRSFEIFAIRDVPKDERSTIWSDGRVARQRSAKPCTAVRIRFRPQLRQRMLPESRRTACAEMAREQCRTAIFHQESPRKLLASKDFFFVRALISLGCFVIACNSAITRRQPARRYLRACPAPARCRQLKTSVFRFRNAEVF